MIYRETLPSVFGSFSSSVMDVWFREPSMGGIIPLGIPPGHIQHMTGKILGPQRAEL